MKKWSIFLGAAMLAVICAAVVPYRRASAESAASLYGQPSVAVLAESKEAIGSLKETKNISSAVFTFGAEGDVLQVLDASGAAIATAEEAFAAVPDGASVLARISDAAVLEKYLAFAEEKGVKRLAVLSSDIAVLSAAETAAPAADLYYAPASASTRDECLTELGKANVLGVQAMVLSFADATADNVRFLQARFKSVWVVTDGSAEQIADAIGSGAIGIMTPDAQAVQSLYAKIALYSETDAKGLPLVVTRAPFVAAHKGDHTVYPENTAEAIADAAKTGATHVEIDIRLTKDNKVVVFHNDQIACNGQNVNVNNLTLAEVKTVDLSGYKVPTLEEVFDAVLATGNQEMIMIVEIKGRETDLVPLFAAAVNSYDMGNRIVAITFYEDQMNRLREQLPSTSVSFLQYVTDGETALNASKARGAGIDMSYNTDNRLQAKSLRTLYGDGSSTAAAYLELFRAFADRGYALWLWTYGLDSMTEAFRYGVTGITTDDPRYASDKVEKLLTDEPIEVENLPKDGDTIEVSALTYKGESVTVPAKVAYLDESGTKAILICRREGEIGLVSGSVTFREGSGSSGSASRGGCRGVAAASSLAAAAAVLTAGVLAIGRKRK